MPHDVKNDSEPANFYTEDASAMIEHYMKMDGFQSIKDELEGIFDLIIIQANRYLELQRQKEDKIPDQNLKLRDCKELEEIRKKISEGKRDTIAG